jgi:hypothetical protein
MQQIPLSQGQVALVDDSDYALLSELKWCYRPERNGRQGYAVRHVKADGKYRTCYLHRTVLPAPPGHETIFLNHDRLDCRRSNLKVVNKEEARQHHRVRSDSKSGAKGVRYNEETESWSAYVYRSGHAFDVGTFGRREQAEAAYHAELRRENPEVHTAPERVERTSVPGPVQREKPDEACVGEGR